jgi:hypothetical protein
MLSYQRESRRLLAQMCLRLLTLGHRKPLPTFGELVKDCPFGLDMWPAISRAFFSYRLLCLNGMGHDYRLSET